MRNPNGTQTASAARAARAPSTRYGVSPMDVLVVDDAPELLDLVGRALVRDGHELRFARSIAEARAELAVRPPDLMVLDVALPDGTGVELCRALRRERARFPILLLTAHSEVAHRVTGLDAGADDFVPKPFAVAELRARVRALLRRGPIERPSIVELGDVELDFGARRAVRGDREIPVTAREWAILEVLVARRGRVVPRTTLLELVWGDASESANQSLEVIVARIRRKLGPEVLRTVRGEGYAAVL